MKGGTMPRSKEASERMRAQSRAQILSAARRLFAERGYFQCKVSDIAREAGMSQGNVYWYFSGKEEVLKAILEEGFGAIEAMTREVAAQSGTARERLDLLIERALALYDEQGNFTTILLSLMAHGGAPFLAELGFDMLQIGTAYHQHLTLVFEQARAEGVVADLDPDVLVMFFFAFLNGMMITYADQWPTLPPDLIRAAVLGLLGGGEAEE
jgi:AcrR family transcriptional regulator